MFLSWIQNTELSIYGTKAVSVFWGPEKNSFFSPGNSISLLFLLGICHNLCLGQDFDLNLMISGSEAVVFFLASGLEDHEQEFNHHQRDLCHHP